MTERRDPINPFGAIHCVTVMNPADVDLNNINANRLTRTAIRCQPLAMAARRSSTLQPGSAPRSMGGAPGRRTVRTPQSGSARALL